MLHTCSMTLGAARASVNCMNGLTFPCIICVSNAMTLGGCSTGAGGGGGCTGGEPAAAAAAARAWAFGSGSSCITCAVCETLYTSSSREVTASSL